ncbi:hypothetical protein LRS06_03675 [Hymenobacter sp. J193]|uniref:hypothetical protein n=1 Tax=Hymenobacter sp. J193 TaxID=2898429 RepID=UPI002150FB7A|nr:hypothetical protein [Hymenobacter sp. J193]MCR5886887.1 hypothetical protein [Hymenobacter sp. J193]
MNLELLLTADVVFYVSYPPRFAFPITKSFRVSLWLSEPVLYFPAEFQIKQAMYPNQQYQLQIILAVSEELEQHFQPETKFLFGHILQASGQGRVIRVDPYMHKPVWVTS